MTLLVIEDHCSWCIYVLQVEWINSIHYVLHAEWIKDHPELKLGLVFYVLQAEWIKDHPELFIYSWSIYIRLAERIKDHPKPSTQLVWFPFNSSFRLWASFLSSPAFDFFMFFSTSVPTKRMQCVHVAVGVLHVSNYPFCASIKAGHEPRRRRPQYRHQTEGLMSKTMSKSCARAL